MEKQDIKSKDYDLPFPYLDIAPKAVNVKPLANYKILIKFVNGERRIFDL